MIREKDLDEKKLRDNWWKEKWKPINVPSINQGSQLHFGEYKFEPSFSLIARFSIPVHRNSPPFYNNFLFILAIHMEGQWSPSDTCPIPSLGERVLSELQVVLTLFRCHLVINVAGIVVVGHPMRRWRLTWEVSFLLSLDWLLSLLLVYTA